jgi:hypothetical protein
MREVAYQNRDNEISFIVKQDGVAVDFSAATRMVLSFADTAVEADSDVDAALIDWSSGDTGEIKLKIGGLALTHGSIYLCTLVVYDATHTSGQTLFSGAEFEVNPKRYVDQYFELLFIDDSQ